MIQSASPQSAVKRCFVSVDFEKFYAHKRCVNIVITTVGGLVGQNTYLDTNSPSSLRLQLNSLRLPLELVSGVMAADLLFSVLLLLLGPLSMGTGTSTITTS